MKSDFVLPIALNKDFVHNLNILCCIKFWNYIVYICLRPIIAAHIKRAAIIQEKKLKVPYSHFNHGYEHARNSTAEDLSNYHSLKD